MPAVLPGRQRLWAISAAGSAARSHREGRGFESLIAQGFRGFPRCCKCTISAFGYQAGHPGATDYQQIGISPRLVLVKQVGALVFGVINRQAYVDSRALSQFYNISRRKRGGYTPTMAPQEGDVARTGSHIYPSPIFKTLHS